MYLNVGKDKDHLRVRSLDFITNCCAMPGDSSPSPHVFAHGYILPLHFLWSSQQKFNRIFKINVKFLSFKHFQTPFSCPQYPENCYFQHQILLVCSFLIHSWLQRIILQAPGKRAKYRVFSAYFRSEIVSFMTKETCLK